VRQSGLRLVPSPILPADDDSYENPYKYDSDGPRIREDRRLFKTLRYVTPDSYPTEDMWQKDGKIAIIHPLVKFDGLRVLAQPPPLLTATEKNDFLAIRDYRRRLYILLVSVSGFILQFTRSSCIRVKLLLKFT
jgi:hypothetical protein